MYSVQYVSMYSVQYVGRSHCSPILCSEFAYVTCLHLSHHNCVACSATMATSSNSRDTSVISTSVTLSTVANPFFVCTLLPKLQRGITSAFRFINNSNILMYSKIIEENCKALKRAYKIYTMWARWHRVVFVPKKYHLIHFTKSHKKFNIKVIINIYGFTKDLISNLYGLKV